ncbi:hypothetical protein PIB30_042870 [Stylosanthes scabra]|uniref:Uncharacterized protein n=1 Tax=Stylosanthes scabra TaxID=79078 RepID=A0ABU6QET5_9FABA|nr:hypothetical protein [Stylosanthes scabra]
MTVMHSISTHERPESYSVFWLHPVTPLLKCLDAAREGKGRIRLLVRCCLILKLNELYAEQGKPGVELNKTGETGIE